MKYPNITDVKPIENYCILITYEQAKTEYSM